VTTTTSPSVPAVVSGIGDLLISFASQAQGDTDVRRLLEIYVEATKHVHRVVAEEAVKSLLYDNPRNPFRPSPQDVYERCSKVLGQARKAVEDWFLGNEWQSIRWPEKWGGAPLTPDCMLPGSFIKEQLSWILQYRRSGGELAYLGREGLGRIPAECFADGQRERALEDIEQREKQEAKRKYLESLDPALREMRSHVIEWNSRGGRCTLSEDKIIDLAKERIAAEEKRRQDLVRTLEELKVSDPEAYENVERKARWKIGPPYKWSLITETERLEAMGHAVAAIELARSVAEERERIANEQPQA
jgi:hypothetical protein